MAMILLNKLSKSNANRPIKVFRVKCSFLLNVAANSGVMVKDTNKLISVENTITSENSRSMFPIIPVTRAIGTKTTTSTRVMATAVKPISERPSTAAFFLFFPISMCRCIFSNTTMESSTKIPMTSDRAKRVIIFSEKSKIYMAANTEMMDAGIETKTMRELLALCKKKNMTTATRMMAKSKSFTTAFADSSVWIELSEEMLNLTWLEAYVFSM